MLLLSEEKGKRKKKETAPSILSRVENKLACTLAIVGICNLEGVCVRSESCICDKNETTYVKRKKEKRRGRRKEYYQ